MSAAPSHIHPHPVPIPIATAPPSVTFTTGVESGGMEAMTIRLVQSLRRWGGRFANCQFVAIQPRFGAPLLKTTRQAFDRLNVQYQSVHPAHGKSWFVWMNKPTTLLAAEAVSTTETIVWVDADMLVLAPPDELDLSDNTDFAACAADKNAGTTGPDDEHDPYWRQMAQQFGLPIDSIPWVITEREKARIRLYFNAGLFAYRRSTGFAAQFMDRCTHLLDARIASTSQGIVLTDQVALGLTMLSMGLRWKPLPLAYNFAMGSKLHRAKLYNPADIATVQILHHHDAMWPNFWPQLLADLRISRPDVADWLAQQGPVTNELPILWKMLNRGLLKLRHRKYLKHEASCAAY